jgi:hypothetical protein
LGTNLPGVVVDEPDGELDDGLGDGEAADAVTSVAP